MEHHNYDDSPENATDSCKRSSAKGSAFANPAQTSLPLATLICSPSLRLLH